MNALFNELRPALSIFALLTLTTGVAYPLAVTGVGRALFADSSRGSIVERDGKAVGSSLIAQPFDDAKHLWPRPSAVAYNAAGSGGSNLGPTNPALADAVKERLGKLGGDAPVDLVTTSASGLDPHVSPAAAEAQVGRIAAARGVDPSAIRAAIARHTEGRTLGVLGSPRVNVLLVNLDLDGVPRAPSAVASTEPIEGWKNRAFDAQ